MRLFEIVDTELERRKRRKITADLSKQHHRVYLGEPASGRPDDGEGAALAETPALGRLGSRIVRDVLRDDWLTREDPLR